MCIRDRACNVHHGHRGHADVEGFGLILINGYGPGGVHIAVGAEVDGVGVGQGVVCLLYTSDAADDLLCVDLGGRRIIKKKKEQKKKKKKHNITTVQTQ